MIVVIGGGGEIDAIVLGSKNDATSTGSASLTRDATAAILFSEDILDDYESCREILLGPRCCLLKGS